MTHLKSCRDNLAAIALERARDGGKNEHQCKEGAAIPDETAV